MKTENQDIYDRLHELYKKHLWNFNNPDSKQIYCMWSTLDPPEEIYDCPQIDDMQDEFNISLAEDDVLELYDMTIDEATDCIAKLLQNKN